MGDASNPLAGVATGRLRWAVNIHEWNPLGETGGAEFKFLLNLIKEQTDRDQVLKYVRADDRKRSLISRLLVRQASALVLGLESFDDIEIDRTKGQKPFLKRPRPSPDQCHLANFNFNVSHEGDWVILASEPLCVCGVDVSAPQQVRPGGAAGNQDIFRDLQDQLTSSEWDFVHAEGRKGVTAAANDVDSRDGLTCQSSSAVRRPMASEGDYAYEAFQRHWSCKEAFVKARGDGLEFPFNRIEFSMTPVADHDKLVDSHSYAPGFSAWVDGDDLSSRWRFFQHRLGPDHWVGLARGPTSDAIDVNGEFKRSLVRPTEQFSLAEWKNELQVGDPPFNIVSVDFLVPKAKREAFTKSKNFAS